MTFKEFERLVKFCKRQGVLKAKFEGVEIEFSKEALQKPIRKSTVPEIQSPVFDEMQTLLYSVQEPM